MSDIETKQGVVLQSVETGYYLKKDLTPTGRLTEARLHEMAFSVHSAKQDYGGELRELRVMRSVVVAVIEGPSG